MTNQLSQLQKLDCIEEDLVESLSSAGAALKELTKDKPNAKVVENLTGTFVSKLDKAGAELSQQIGFLLRATTSQSNEGSSYAHKKDIKLAHTRLEHSQTRLKGLKTSANKL